MRIEIRILEDGRVVFGDLPPDLAEVAALLSGEAPTCSRDAEGSAAKGSADNGSADDGSAERGAG